jgi:hypothetical protein
MDVVAGIFSQLLPILVSLCIPVVLVLARYISKKLADSLGIKDTKILDELILSLVTQGIAYAEQMAHKISEEKQLEGHEKLQLAISFVKKELDRLGIVGITAQEIADKIEAMLGMDKIGDGPQEGHNEDLDSD